MKESMGPAQAIRTIIAGLAATEKMEAARKRYMREHTQRIVEDTAIAAGLAPPRLDPAVEARNKEMALVLSGVLPGDRVVAQGLGPDGRFEAFVTKANGAAVLLRQGLPVPTKRGGRIVMEAPVFPETLVLVGRAMPRTMAYAVGKALRDVGFVESELIFENLPRYALLLFQGGQIKVLQPRQFAL